MVDLLSDTGMVSRSQPLVNSSHSSGPEREGGIQALLTSSVVNHLQIPPGGAPPTLTSLTKGCEAMDLLTGEVNK